MSLSRRTLFRLGAASLAAAAVGGGVAYQQWRKTGGRSSMRITGPWPELGPQVNWLLPDLHDAHMEVPDRPHDMEETRDPRRRAAVKRTREFTVNSSARRLRGDSFGPLPPAGVKRIVAIGDSTTFGWGVADNETWPARLQAELTRRGQKVEVLNAGVPAQALEGMVAWLRTVGPTMGLHGVLFTRRPPPAGGDPLQAYAQAVANVRRALPSTRVHVLLSAISQFDPHGLQVWQGEDSGLRARITDTPVFDMTPSIRAAQGTRGCRIEVAGQGIRVVRGETGETLISAAASRHGLPVEVYALLEKDPTVREALFFDDGHLDADGYAIMAPIVADQLTTAGWFS
ncbi:MAG: hypothetical protein EXR71_16675 [Myxococcales bacterium]|nr:hypothetical protein [Myxococcales bacterium]